MKEFKISEYYIKQRKIIFIFNLFFIPVFITLLLCVWTNVSAFDIFQHFFLGKFLIGFFIVFAVTSLIFFPIVLTKFKNTFLIIEDDFLIRKGKKTEEKILYENIKKIIIKKFKKEEDTVIKIIANQNIKLIGFENFNEIEKQLSEKNQGKIEKQEGRFNCNRVLDYIFLQIVVSAAFIIIAAYFKVYFSFIIMLLMLGMSIYFLFFKPISKVQGKSFRKQEIFIGICFFIIFLINAAEFKHGNIKKYREGKLSEEANYFLGVKQGIEKYYNTYTGKVYYLNNYTDGELQNSKFYDENGKLTKEIFYKDRQKVKEVNYKKTEKPTVTRYKLIKELKGKIAPDINAKDINGNLIKLSELKGNIVLLDFWASWCGPCRREIPEVKRIYEEYKDKGLKVISISSDRREEKALDIIYEYKMNWINIIDKGDIFKKYNISAIPQIMLIDKQGKVYEVYLRGSRIEKTVKELIK